MIRAGVGEICPYSQRMRRMEGQKNTTRSNPVIGDGVLPLVTRLIKWTVAKHRLPPDRFPIHSLRPGGATCLYPSGVDLEYMRRAGRWKSNTFSIYLHLGGKIRRNLSSRMVKCEGLTSQLRVCAGGRQEVVFDRGGDMVNIQTKTMGKEACVCQPTMVYSDT